GNDGSTALRVMPDVSPDQSGTSARFAATSSAESRSAIALNLVVQPGRHGRCANLKNWGGARMRDRALCGEMARILAHWPARESRAWPEARDRRGGAGNCGRGGGGRAGGWGDAGPGP